MKKYKLSRNSKGCILGLINIFTSQVSAKQVFALRAALPTNAEKPSQLHPDELERLAVYVYQRLGYLNVKHTGSHSSTDGGVDVWLLSKSGNVEIVQCKQWKSRISKSELIQFAKTMRQQHAIVGHYWAPNGFSEPAILYAEQNAIRLYNDFAIRKILERAEENKLIDLENKKPIRNKKGFSTTQVTIVMIMFIVLFITMCSLFASIIKYV
jgi:hypothetical protein